MICSDIWHKYHEWYFEIWDNFELSIIVSMPNIISRTNHAIICLYYYPQKVVIFTCRYFKLSWNTTALSQSNCRNFSCSSIITKIQKRIIDTNDPQPQGGHVGLCCPRQRDTLDTRSKRFFTTSLVCSRLSDRDGAWVKATGRHLVW